MNEKRARYFSLLLICLFLLCLGTAGYYALQHPPHLPKPPPIQPGNYKVTEFYDGDTIAVNVDGRIEKVRLIGVDTPETHDPRKAVQCFGQAASNFIETLIGNDRVRLEADPLNTNRDRYNRLLRYVYLPDGRLVNAEIIKQGYGFAYTGFPFSKSDEFKDLQNQAKNQNRGLWGNCQPTINEYGGYSSNPATN